MDERNFTYMFYGFSVAWGIIALYAIGLLRRQSNINSQVESLKKMVEGKRKFRDHPGFRVFIGILSS